MLDFCQDPAKQLTDDPLIKNVINTFLDGWLAGPCSCFVCVAGG